MGLVVNIFIADINTACKCRLSIYNDDLSVISIVETVSQEIKQHFLKRVNFNTGSSHSFFNLFLNVRTSKIIINKAYLYAFICFLYQKFFDLFTNFILLINVIFNMNMVFCMAECLQYFRKFFFPV